MNRFRFRSISAVIMAVILGLQFSAPGPAAGITIQEEETLGREFMKLASRRYRIINDPAIAGYVNEIGRRLLAQIPPQPFQYRFFVIQQDVYNAFAGPAGHIFINSGLIEAMENEDELAGIMAHEITHVQARHISQRIERSSRIQWAALAGMVAGIFLGMGGAAEAGNALSMGSVAATQSAALAYSRQDEMQADELGIDTLSRAGYSGAAMLTMLQKIRDQKWFGPSEVPSYLMTHPAVDDRLAYLDTWIQGHPDTVALMGRRANTPFLRFRTRLIAAYGDPASALRQMTAAINDAPEDPMALHGYGIALARNNRAEEGMRYVRKALQKFPFDAVMLKDLGEIAFMAGQYDAARKALEGSKGINPDDFETYFLLGRTWIELGNYSAGAAALKTALEKQPGANRTLYYIGEAYGKAGRTADAHYYLGRYYHGRGEFKTAAFHLRQVIKHSQDPRQKAEAEEMLSSGRRAAPQTEDKTDERRKRRNAPLSYGQNGKTAW